MSASKPQPEIRLAAEWAGRLRAVAGAGLPGLDVDELRVRPGAFRDELGHRRPVDALLVQAALGGTAENPPDEGVSSGAEDAEVGLWALALGAGGEPDGLLAAGVGGPLLKHRPKRPIEVVTETELCALHALWTVASLRRRTDLRERCLAAAAWHVEELQPDNATHLPWAIHVFVIAAAIGQTWGLIEAETRLHNAIAGRGKPDRRSTFVLLHAAAELERAL